MGCGTPPWTVCLRRARAASPARKGAPLPRLCESRDFQRKDAPGSGGMHRGGGPRGLRTRGTSVSHVTLLCASHNGSSVTVGQCMS